MIKFASSFGLLPLVTGGGAEGSRTLTGWNLNRLHAVAPPVTWA
jgi:hypothetical protein